ncbi:hypothetical protein ACFQZ8_03060 [Micromonospora azadirachtae]|uniref:Secreted protein n=1 Tax=Micromonospora azadirachtae TaxID=1970735 RepID=A0ABW2ZX42_9ACTN
MNPYAQSGNDAIISARLLSATVLFTLYTLILVVVGLFALPTVGRHPIGLPFAIGWPLAAAGTLAVAASSWRTRADVIRGPSGYRRSTSWPTKVARIGSAVLVVAVVAALALGVAVTLTEGDQIANFALTMGAAIPVAVIAVSARSVVLLGHAEAAGGQRADGR